MYVEKNVCDNILGTLLDLPGKNKDSLIARLGLKEMNMHEKLRAKLVGGKYQYPAAPFNLTLDERRKVVTLLSKLAVPDGYSSNVTRCVTLHDGKIIGMKSHDCHVFMQDLLVPVFRGVLDDKVLEPLSELSAYFKQLCSKTLKVDDIEKMEKNIVVILCKLERIFVPAFFDVMVHLCVHLATEVKLGGPVHYRWMYAFERLMCIFKSYTRNKSRLEGSIAESVAAKDCLTFISRYLNTTETQFNRMDRNDDVEHTRSHHLSVFSMRGKPLGKASMEHLGVEEWNIAHSYVVKNCEEAQPFVDEYQDILGEQQIDFCEWIESRITNLWNKGDQRVTEELLCLARGPLKGVVTYEGYVTNGFRFHTKRRQRKRKTQNSGVMVKGDKESGEKNFYGILEKVVILEYDTLQDRTSPRVVLFKCKWFDVFDGRRGIKRDKFGDILINVTRKLKTNEPFALASQIVQIFYVPTHNEPQWRIVIETKPHNYFYFPNDEKSDDHDDHDHDRSLWDEEEIREINEVQVGDGSDNEDVSLARDDVEPNVVDVDGVQLIMEYPNDDFEDGLGMEDDDDDSDEDDEEEFSDRESSMDSLDRNLEEVEMESHSSNEEYFS